MLKLGRKVEYGLMALLHIAEAEGDDPISKREISEAYDIPSELLGKVLQSLKKAGLVESVQGIHGGYTLSRNIEEIALGDVIEAIDGPMHRPECVCINQTCDRVDVCNIKSMMDRFYGHLEDFIFGTTLSTFKTGFDAKTTSITVNAKG